MSEPAPTLQDEPWRRQLRELRAGPYAGRGGRTALAQALGYPLDTVNSYTKGRRAPSWQRRQEIRRLWESYGLDADQK